MINKEKYESVSCRTVILIIFQFSAECHAEESKKYRSWENYCFQEIAIWTLAIRLPSFLVMLPLLSILVIFSGPVC